MTATCPKTGNTWPGNNASDADGLCESTTRPTRAALAAINAKRGPWYPLNNNSGVLNAIVAEWAALTGINKCKVEMPMTAATRTGITAPIRAPARESGGDWPKWADSWLAGWLTCGSIEGLAGDRYGAMAL